jgi:hypothetical protein
MEDKTLSPAAQAVMDAYLANWADEPLSQDACCLAAALRAVADQVAPDDYASFTGHIEWDQGMEARSDSIREAILAIAAELEARAN